MKHGYISLAAACPALTGCATPSEPAPMPLTRGMAGVDPAMHMRHCHSSDETPPPNLGPLQHGTPGH